MTTTGLIKTIAIGNQQYNVTRCTAVQQKTLMTLIGNRVLANSAAAARINCDIDVNFVVGVLMTTDEPTLDQITRLVLHKTIKSGGDSLVTIDSWDCGIMDWFLLLANAVEFNLSDFFIWLGQQYESTSDPVAPKNQM